MINKIGINGAIINFNNKKYKINQTIHSFNIIIDENTKIWFEAEGRNGGLYFKIQTLFKNNRYYTSPKYHSNYICFIREVAFALCLNNYLWDYEVNEPLYDVREERGLNKNMSRLSESYYGIIKNIEV